MVFPQLEKHQNIMQVPEKIQSTLANGHLCKMDTVARHYEIKTHENPVNFFMIISHVFHRFFRRF